MLKTSLVAFSAVFALGLSEASAAKLSANRLAPKLPTAGIAGFQQRVDPALPGSSRVPQSGAAFKPSVLPNYSYETLNRLFPGNISKPLPVLGSEHSLVELIGVYSPSKEEVRKLREAANRGDPEAQFYGNLGLVMSIAKRYSYGMEYEDLVQAGQEGLLKAMEKFKPKKGVPFSNYAGKGIEMAMRRAISKEGHTIRIPPHAAQEVSKALKWAKEYRQTHNQEPTSEDYIQGLKLKPKQARRILAAMQMKELLSLDVTVDEDEETGLSDLLPDSSENPAENAANHLIQEDVEKALASLNEREAEIIRLRFGLGTGEEKTLEEVGEKFKISRERVRQIEAAALRKLHHRALRAYK